MSGGGIRGVSTAQTGKRPLYNHTAVFLSFILLAGLGEIAASRAASPGVAGVLHKHGFSDRTERADVILLSHDNEPPLIRLLTGAANIFSVLSDYDISIAHFRKNAIRNFVILH